MKAAQKAAWMLAAIGLLLTAGCFLDIFGELDIPLMASEVVENEGDIFDVLSNFWLLLVFFVPVVLIDQFTGLKKKRMSGVKINTDE